MVEKVETAGPQTSVIYKMDQLKIEIKLWERSFEKENGRLPEKEDIKADKEIKRKYKQYAQYKKLIEHQGKQEHLESKQSGIDQTPVKAVVDDAKAEFGPTPQMNGKLVSIFEMKFSLVKDHSSETLEAVGSPVRGQESVRRQLNFAITPGSSPIKGAPKLEYSGASTTAASNGLRYGPNSPMRVDDIGLKLSDTPKTLGRMHDVKSSPYSPSPLIKRPSKTLSELAKEHALIKNEFESNTEEFSEFNAIRTLTEKLMQEEKLKKIDEEAEEDDNANTSAFIRKAKTIKKKTRAKMRPAPATLNEVKQNKMLNTNVHERLAKLKQREYNRMLGKDDIENDSDSETEMAPTPAKKQRKKNSKYNLVSNNFKRLNLPTKAGRNRAKKWRSRM